MPFKKPRIEPQLKEAGCEMSPMQFRLAMRDFFKEHRPDPDWTPDELGCHPTDAIAFCNTVRQQGGEFANLPDDLILRCILGLRKLGLWK